MAKQSIKPKKKPTRTTSGRADNSLPFKKKNYVLFSVGIAVILLGYLFLSRNSITIAPLLLVAGYCVIIPLAIALK